MSGRVECLSRVIVVQMAERQEALQAAAAEDAVAKAAVSELLQQKQVLIQDNEACEAAISDVTDRKQVLLAILPSQLL